MYTTHSTYYYSIPASCWKSSSSSQHCYSLAHTHTHTTAQIILYLVPLRKLIHYAQPHSIFVGDAVACLQVCVIVSMCPFPEPDDLAKTCNSGLTSQIISSAFQAEGLLDEKECVSQSAASHCCFPYIRSENTKKFAHQSVKTRFHVIE